MQGFADLGVLFYGWGEVAHFNAYNRPKPEVEKYGGTYIGFLLMGAIQKDWRNKLSIFTEWKCCSRGDLSTIFRPPKNISKRV